TPPCRSSKAGLPHQAAHPLAADANADLRELVVNPRRAVAALELREERSDLLQKLAIAPSVGRFLFAFPRVVRAWGHAQHFAHHADLGGGLLRKDETVEVYSSSFAKKAAAFFRMVFSIRSRSFSLRSRRFSSSSVSPLSLRFATAACSNLAAQRWSWLAFTPKSSATWPTVRSPRLRIIRTASRLNSSV